MRGRIIQYNGNDGTGLISANGQQYPFTITQWRSESAPAINATVEFDHQDAQSGAVQLVSNDVLLKEQAGALAGKLGTFGGAALQSVQGMAAGRGDGDGGNVANMPGGNIISRFGKPILIAHAIFVIAALFLDFVTIGSRRGYTLAGLSELSERLGLSAGSAALGWLAILALLLPVFWRDRRAWLALLLPLLAVFVVSVEILIQLSDTPAFLRDLFGFGAGAWLCWPAALALSVLGIKRFLSSPT